VSASGPSRRLWIADRVHGECLDGGEGGFVDVVLRHLDEHGGLFGCGVDTVDGGECAAEAGGGTDVRTGDYRIVYEICADALIVLVLAVGDRSEIHRSR
jgi:hypothetical protein